MKNLLHSAHNTKERREIGIVHCDEANSDHTSRFHSRSTSF